MSAPTEKENELLQKFRENINDMDLNKDQLNDMFLLSWIRARENDLGKAEDMLRNSMNWRTINNIDNIFEWEPPESFATWCPYEITGLDNDGRPVAVIPLGKWDVRTLVESGLRTTYIRYVDKFFMYVMKYLKEHSLKMGHTQFVAIIDLKGFGMRQIMSPSAVETVLETFRRFEANYPETLRTCYIVNAPRIFPMAFAMVKPLLSGRTLQKVKIFNSNESKWKPALLDSIPAETLPTIYGGIETKYNNSLNGIPINNEPIEDFVRVTVGAGVKFLLDYNIECPESIIRWEFKTDDFDIGFSISKDKQEIFPYKRCESHLRKESGSIICFTPGKYTIAFDNTFSRLREKTLSYLVIITGAQNEANEENNNEYI